MTDADVDPPLHTNDCARRGTSGMTAFRAWCYKHELSLHKSEKKTRETHLMLDGGKLGVPPELMDQFYERYARSLFEGERMYVSERRTPVFNMFAELDYKSAEGLTRDQVVALAASFQRNVILPCFEGAFPDADADPNAVLEDPLRLVVSTPDAFAKDDHGTKSGIHLNWKIPVSDETAKYVRQLFMDHFLTLMMTGHGREAPGVKSLVEIDDYANQWMNTVGAPTCDDKSNVQPARTISDYYHAAVPTSDNNQKKKRDDVNRKKTMAMTTDDAILTPATMPTAPVSDIFDVQVYEGCGLRMIGSRKADTCPECKNVPCRKHVDTLPPSIAPALQHSLHITIPSTTVTLCATCGGTGKIDMGRPYYPVAVLDRRGEANEKALQAMLHDEKMLVMETKLRLPENTIDVPIGSSVMLDRANACIATQRKRTRRTSASLASSGEPSGPAATRRKTSDTKRVDVCDASRSAVKKWDGMPLEHVLSDDPQYETVAQQVMRAYNLDRSPKTVRSIMTNSTHTTFVVTTNSKYCLNKNAEHTHATVYYIVRPIGVTQKCFSKKDIIYVPSMRRCSEYESAPVPLPQSIVPILFSQHAKSTFNKMQKMSETMRASVDSFKRVPSFADLYDTTSVSSGYDISRSPTHQSLDFMDAFSPSYKLPSRVLPSTRGSPDSGQEDADSTSPNDSSSRSKSSSSSSFSADRSCIESTDDTHFKTPVSDDINNCPADETTMMEEPCRPTTVCSSPVAAPPKTATSARKRSSSSSSRKNRFILDEAEEDEEKESEDLASVGSSNDLYDTEGLLLSKTYQAALKGPSSSKRRKRSSDGDDPDKKMKLYAAKLRRYAKNMRRLPDTITFADCLQLVPMVGGNITWVLPPLPSTASSSSSKVSSPSLASTPILPRAKPAPFVY